MSQSDTKDRILDAAEQLFAEEGFHCTSMRTITSAAGANLAAINYHFGSKESLIAAVIDRRLGPLNQLRRQRLAEVAEAARRRGEIPRVRDVLAAFVEPTLEFRETCPGSQAFITLVGRALAVPDDTIRRHFLARMEPLMREIFDLLNQAVPGLPRETLYWRFHFVIGALSHTLCWAGRPSLEQASGFNPPTAAAPLSQIILDFLIGGLEAPCSR